LILFRAVQAIVKAQKFPAYQANITAYTVACISRKTGGRIDFDYIWTLQALSPEMQTMINHWVVEIDKELRRTAGSRMPSEWAKKAECWEAVRNLPLDLPEPLPQEMQAQIAGRTEDRTRLASRNESLSREDLELIEKCRQIDAPTWFKVARWGTKSKTINWRVVAIAKTVGEYAIGGWERSPSAKQAKWAMEAYKTAQTAGALSNSASAP
jgi:hypothetical protein